MEGEAGVVSKLGAEVMVVVVEGWAEEEVVKTRHRLMVASLLALKALKGLPEVIERSLSKL